MDIDTKGITIDSKSIEEFLYKKNIDKLKTNLIKESNIIKSSLYRPPVLRREGQGKNGKVKHYTQKQIHGLNKEERMRDILQQEGGVIKVILTRLLAGDIVTTKNLIPTFREAGSKITQADISSRIRAIEQSGLRRAIIKDIKNRPYQYRFKPQLCEVSLEDCYELYRKNRFTLEMAAKKYPKISETLLDTYPEEISDKAIPEYSPVDEVHENRTLNTFPAKIEVTIKVLFGFL